MIIISFLHMHCLLYHDFHCLFFSFTRLDSIVQTLNQRIAKQINNFPANTKYVRRPLPIDLHHTLFTKTIIIIATKIPLPGQLFIFQSNVRFVDVIL